MEDYDTFVQHRLSHVRKREEEHNKPSPTSSLIRFYGQPILPPLLSGEQREEMQRHRDAAQKAAVHRKLKDEGRMAYVQTILHSVQLRTTPTLEELLQETEIDTKSSYSHNTSGESVSQSNFFVGTKGSLSLSPPPERKEKELYIQHNPTETEPADNHEDEAKPSEEPYRLSLQALLKKSQEYRRRQRMLRNQAKNTKIQERTQEQPKARAEEQSLSDKENDEFPYKGTVTADGKKTKERRGTFIPSVETSPKKSWENEKTKSSQHIDQLEYNLSSLKVLISDLESTLTENLESHSQTESNTQSEFSFETIKQIKNEQHMQLCQSDSDYVEDKLRDDDSNDAEQDQRYRERPRRRSLDNFKNKHEDTGSEPSISDTDDVPLTAQSYDVDAPSGLWLLEGSGSDLGSKGGLVQEKHLTPESGGEGQGGVSKVKRRLLMHMTEETQDGSADFSGGAGSAVRPNSSTPQAAVQQYEGHGSQKDKQDQLKRAHAAQVRALQDEHRRQQEELLQALAVRYRVLQSVSFPCSMSSSRLGDTLTFSTLSQPSSPLSECYRPLLVAAVKGFLTRRLLKTERVAQLVRTIRDTQQFLQALLQQSPGRGEFCSRQDLLLQERVTLQLRAARYEVNDIFFSLSAGERMQLISWDRELARERDGHTGHPRGKSSLSAATQKSLERKRGMMIQKKAAGRHRGVVTRTGHNTGFSAEQPLETKRGQFRANPQRVPKTTYSSRPR
ncbi:centriolar coiled-coil protein of 110 kDa [Enoplosus armatus]|uniref:centriolar coiled-coil protein of 110 kDa n=1 Tax=Enoplosus armatus TaxID=215367 RepID=UPI0039932EC7